MAQVTYGVGWSRSIDEYMLREEAFRIIDMTDTLSAILLESETEKDGVTGYADHQYLFERRKLNLKFSRYCDGPRKIFVKYDGKLVFFADEETAYHNGDMHVDGAMAVYVEENAFLDGTWAGGKPEWLKEIEKLYDLARRFEDRKERLEGRIKA